ncbi:Rieske (2Fe-2S) protein [Streptomyces sp. FXJ1.4098]|nr:Rieske (2Fe-2S) protein [Streptomyces sp. FXJ1.4098]
MNAPFTTENIHELAPPDLVQADRVAGRMYTDPEIFELEMGKIFERTWVWVAHESELPKAGSFKSTFVGRRPVIVVRDRKGRINTLVNRCRHRGASLCEQKKGQVNGFTCPYHAWSYGLDGALRGIPTRTATRASWRRGTWGCRSSAPNPTAGWSSRPSMTASNRWRTSSAM